MPTVLHRLARWSDETPDAPAQGFKESGVWKTISAREFKRRMYYLALFLQSRGIGAGDTGAILGPNAPEWVHAHLGTMLAGAMSTGLYPNSTSKDILYILNHTGARVLSVKNKEFFDKITDEQGHPALPSSVELVILFEGDPATVSPIAVTYQAAIDEGKLLSGKPGAKKIEDLLQKVDPVGPSFMIFTSGTTGNPKGALLSHDNLIYTSDCVSKFWELPRADGNLFSFLPLCHVAETLQNIGVGISQRYLVNFCTKFDNVSKELVEVQPSLLLCVPRLWEKMMEGVEGKVAKTEGVKKKLTEWALATGARVAAARYAGKFPPLKDLLQFQLADKLVLSKIRHALGLANAKTLASGAAALAPHVTKWFRSIGLEILEDFGQTETTGVICMTEAGVESAGTVGKPVSGIEVKIAEDGEVLCKGRNVFLGYYKDEANTKAAFTADGWLSTGDLAELTDTGLIKIRGRKKEVLKTSGGKMIAPLPIEEKLKAAPVISQVCVVGDGRKFLSALITLSETALADAKTANVNLDQETIQDPKVVAKVRTHVDELNRELASFEQIKKFSVLSREFSIVDGEMTPTLKMKRNVIEKRFMSVIDSMYT